jgi:hypothetical protein
MMFAALFSSIPGINTFAATCGGGSFLGLVPWYNNLVNPTTCAVDIGTNGLVNSDNWDKIWVIGLNIFQDLLVIAGIVALGFVIYAAFRYVTSQGEPENTKKALGTIINALTGLGIAIIASPFVSYLSNKLGGNVTSNAYDLPNVAASSNTLQVLLTFVFGIIGGVAVLMIVISGLKFVTAGGNPERTTKAKDTILYALIGVVVAIVAEAIINFVVFRIG